uniref:Uncharacterized protein n=1 Tax=Anopheles atroparvus TaxID=41427 RepID=A0AAG5DNJ4_ANOAO
MSVPSMTTSNDETTGRAYTQHQLRTAIERPAEPCPEEKATRP